MNQPGTTLQLLAVGADTALCGALAAGGWVVTAAERLDAAQLTGARQYDVLLMWAGDGTALNALPTLPGLSQAAFDGAVVVAGPAADDAAEGELLSLGVEAVVQLQGPGGTAALLRELRHAVQRKRVERSARTAYATDLATGLPHQAQLLEHMTQLVALREREPQPMALLVLRLQGFTQAAARLGGEAANILRRKVAVRLRGNLRAGDVVAAIGPDTFGVLLGHLEAAGDGEQVAAKLLRALQQPLQVAGQPCRVAAAVGLALYPQHGKEAAALLQRAHAQAASLATGGAQALPMGLVGSAANDEPPPGL